ncbi:hypothetical protein GGTG_10945 [Gaeumannomyces tritici R3-111a-1]|uniref:Succinate dehydrogenase assembly factor 4, mitochondrial n=1 Tax=Gaeumannomyces tritici (strain R3-111a-1) TaxID=644352 RepID=J3PBS4_GAET3|nr:hypothetical protein GGTG_10945 [Gaeumannomyces tritici R3-111a-1]EJT71691.1 hypothetical protein GGTG_10945 [Gaeumannomyces tritici R3-111a-1]
MRPLLRAAHLPARSPLRPRAAAAAAPRRLLLLLRPSSTFAPGPAPPRLPAAEQAEFERLQREAASVGDAILAEQPEAAAVTTAEEEAPATSGGIRRGAPPEFDGDVNPKTGEVGGPKNEPLRWGAAGDYSFNGRVTDF